jgi:hypothetical protein
MIPTPRQQGMDETATDTGAPHGSWARLLTRMFALDMARCPCCQQGTLHLIAALTPGVVIQKILPHLQLAADPPPHRPSPSPRGRLCLGLRLTASGPPPVVSSLAAEEC